MVDVLLVIIVLLSIAWGFLRGALYDFLGLVALLAAYIGSAPFGDSLGGPVASATGVSAGVGYVTGRVIAGVLIYASLKVSAAVANRKFGMTGQGITKRWNRNLGAVGGLLKGIVMVLIILLLLDSVYKAFPESDSAFVRAARGSAFREWVGDHNPADRFLVADTLRLLSAAREDPEVLKRLREDERVLELLNHPTLRAVTEDAELVEAIRNRELDRVLQDPELRRLLSDQELLRRILSPDVPPNLQDAIREAMEESTSEEGEVMQPPARPERRTR